MSAQGHASQADLYEAMQRVVQAFASEPSLKTALANPAVSAADKGNLIAVASGLDSGSNAYADLSAFVSLLIANRRIDLMQLCAAAYVKLYRQAHSIYHVDIASAAPLTDDEKQRLTSLVERQLPPQSTAHCAFAVKPSLIGGFTIDIDNFMLDASVSTELNQIRQKLLSH